jgi:hypothetical protein
MSRPEHEVADVIRMFGENFVSKHNPNSYQLRVLRALSVGFPEVGPIKIRV